MPFTVAPSAGRTHVNILIHPPTRQKHINLVCFILANMSLSISKTLNKHSSKQRPDQHEYLQGISSKPAARAFGDWRKVGFMFTFRLSH